MKVSKAMTREVRTVSPDETIRDAARTMSEIDAGALPVGENDRLVGMITDRDIALRAIGQGKGPDTAVRDVMSAGIKYCFEDDDTEEVARNLGQQQLRRLPVLNRDKRLVGILALADIAVNAGRDAAGEAITGVSQPGGSHNQSGERRGARLEGREHEGGLVEDADSTSVVHMAILPSHISDDKV